MRGFSLIGVQPVFALPFPSKKMQQPTAPLNCGVFSGNSEKAMRLSFIISMLGVKVFPGMPCSRHFRPKLAQPEKWLGMPRWVKYRCPKS